MAVNLVLTSGVSTAQAGYLDGNTLNEQCSSNDASIQNLCGFYVAGVIDSVESTKGKGILGWNFCVPVGVTIGQLTGIMSNWLRNNPQKRQYKAMGLVGEALQAVYPCATPDKTPNESNSSANPFAK